MAVTYGEGGKLITMTAAEDTVEGLVLVKSIRWVKPATAGDDLVIQDGAGTKTVSQMTCSTQYGDEVDYIEDWVNGLHLETLDSGTVLIRVI
jgi:hypothetical protein